MAEKALCNLFLRVVTSRPIDLEEAVKFCFCGFFALLMFLISALASLANGLQAEVHATRLLVSSESDWDDPTGPKEVTIQGPVADRRTKSDYYYGYDKSLLLTPSGCNSVAYAQLPGRSSYFLGRQFYNRSGAPVVSRGGVSLATEAGCADNSAVVEASRNARWGLVLTKLDWERQRFVLVKPLLAPFTEIAAGPFRGMVLRSIYDPDIVSYHGQYLVAFECGFGPAGRAHGIYGASACLAVYDPVQQVINPATITVVVSGRPERGRFYSASIPHLLIWNDRLFIYYSVVTRERGAFVHVAIRGAEVIKGETSFFQVKDTDRLAYSIAPPTIEVWAPDESYLSDTTAGIRSVWSKGDRIVMLAGLGGKGCAVPRGPQPGCFHMAMSFASRPLGLHAFNDLSTQAEAVLPTNAQIYSRPIRSPEGQCLLIGAFYRPFRNGFSELRPAPSNWKDITGNAVLLAFPFEEQLCPRE